MVYKTENSRTLVQVRRFALNKLKLIFTNY